MSLTKHYFGLFGANSGGFLGGNFAGIFTEHNLGGSHQTNTYSYAGLDQGIDRIGSRSPNPVPTAPRNFHNIYST